MKPYLIECSLCGGKMSSVALSCPHCGNPNDTSDKATANAEKSVKKRYTKRTDGRYETKVSTGKVDDNGNVILVTVYGRTITELEKNKAETKTDLSRGTYANDKGYTVKQWALIWKDTYKPNNKSYENIIKNHFEHIENYRLKDLTKSAIQKQINSMDGHYDLQRRVKMTVNQMIESAIEDGLLYKNVCKKVELPKKPKTDKRALRKNEIEAIKNANLNTMQRAFIIALYNLGIRRGEALALRKDSFDFNSNLVHISNAVSFKNSRPIFGDTKSFAGDRYIDLIEPFRTEIKQYVDGLNEIYLFTNTKGELLPESAYKRFIQGILREINTSAGGKQHYDTKMKKWIIDINVIDGLTPHIFRHNYATNLYYANVDIKEAQRLLGHADAKTTIEIYTHLDKEKSKSTEKIQEYYKAVNI